MYRGYVKLWRKTLDAGWIRQPKLFVFWIWCLLKASHRECDVLVGYQKVHLMPGDFVFGLRSAALELRLSEQSIRTLLGFLKKTQNLTVKSTNKFSIISIVNWDIYQAEESTVNTQTNTCLTHKQQTNNTQITTNKNVKNVKNVKKKEYTADFLNFWEAYPNKIGKDAAFKSWQSRNGDRPAIDIIISVIDQQKEWSQWQKDGGQYIPKPTTWLNEGRWADEGRASKWFK